MDPQPPNSRLAMPRSARTAVVVACLVLGAAAWLALPAWASRAARAASAQTSVASAPTHRAASRVVQRFAVWGDTRPTSSSWPTTMPTGFTKLAAKLGRQSFSFSVAVGDYANLSGGDSASVIKAKYEAFRAAEAPIRKRHVYYVVGNHEILSDATARTLFHSELGAPQRDWYRVKNGALNILVLSAYEPNYSGTIGYVGEGSSSNSAQARWLVATLRKIRAANRHAWIVVAVHCPPFDPKPDDPWASSSGEKSRLVKLFDKYGVDAVVAGHVHNYRRHVAADGITYLTQGTGGAPVYSVNTVPLDSHDRKAFANVYGYTMFTLRANGSLRGVTTEASPSDWVFKVRDSFALRNRAAR
ncbi:MAG TPA: metallophosphoesterase [Thermoleophilia bacterium]|nr:metallophosphoesterase [Thermoleophilia bacterium]